MLTFCGWSWREKQKDILQKQSSRRVLQEKCSKIFGKAYRKTREQEPFFFFLNQDIGLQIYLKKGSCIDFFSVKFLKLFRKAFLYSTAVIRCLWFNWILGNFDHLRFTPIPEHFDHHSWFYRKYLKFWRSYETIWKPYLEHDIA